MTKPLRLITWNINSIRARIEHLARLVEETNPDLVCLQETKVADAQFPANAVRKMGFEHIETNGKGGHHGVATLSKRPLRSVERHLFCGQDDGRHLAVTVDHNGPLRVHNLYVPAGGDVPDRQESEKFAHKLDFVDELGGYLASEPNERRLAVGDLNIAPYAADVWSHKQLLKVVSHTPIEVEKHEASRNQAGMIDLVRHHFGMDEKLYSWWSYRAKDWRKSNRGRRLDHIWASPDLSAQVDTLDLRDTVRDWEKTSDHIPIVLSLN